MWDASALGAYGAAGGGAQGWQVPEREPGAFGCAAEHVHRSLRGRPVGTPPGASGSLLPFVAVGLSWALERGRGNGSLGFRQYRLPSRPAGPT